MGRIIFDLNQIVEGKCSKSAFLLSKKVYFLLLYKLFYKALD
ncbi:hypothetical protein PMCN06_0564 [Pasteurella multocida subsp. multocida str. HN06]|nr:hypothetical protein PMCN06_0564 [Pasteurella multocida subsp. multocida str. HN06]AFI45901.1 hypothetical protein NT08PM_0766 [Pasteurella multocida subsp. multocida str. 3480]